MANVYSSLKPFGFADRLLRDPGQTLTAPVHVRIKPINACNHHCWFCAYRAEAVELGNAMDLKDRIPAAKMDEIVADLIAMGVRAVTFSGGGEPLLYPEIASVVERLAVGGVRVAALTNGAYLTGSVADALARYGTWVRISTDGWDDSSLQQSRRTRPGEFTRIIGNIRSFTARQSSCALGISYIVTESNAPHIAEFAELAKTLGVRHVKVSGCVVANDVAENNRYHDAIRQVVADQIEHALRLNDASFTLVDHYHELSEHFQNTYHDCAMLEFLTVIGADCTVYTCQDKAYTAAGKLGSIADRSFRDLWQSAENLTRIRELDPTRDCNHHCVAHQKNVLLNEFRSLDRDHLGFV